MYLIYRKDGDQKIPLGYADDPNQAAVIMMAEIGKIDCEQSIGMELLKEDKNDAERHDP